MGGWQGIRELMTLAEGSEGSVFRGFQTLILLAVVVSASRAQDAEQPDWSSKSTPLPQFMDSISRSMTLPAPNGKLSLRVEAKKTRRLYPNDEFVPDYFLERNGHRLHPAIHPYASPYGLWSPDSNLLAITSSDGGLVGNWKVYVYSVEGGEVVRHDVMRQVQAELARTFPAGVNPPGASSISRTERIRFARDLSWVNVFAVRWLEESERLLVLAGVPPSSGYGMNMQQHRAYIVEPTTGHILHACTEEESKESDSDCSVK